MGVGRREPLILRERNREDHGNCSVAGFLAENRGLSPVSVPVSLLEGKLVGELKMVLSKDDKTTILAVGKIDCDLQYRCG